MAPRCGIDDTGTLADAAALRTRTHAAALGAPRSVFVSHSWHDPREAKWAALRAWAERYEAEHGAPPLLWLDAACVAQDSSTDRSLALLPLYIAGCQRMVVLAGSTFLERLWCVIEIFTFLFMGGSLDRIDVLPIGDDTMEQVEERLSSFDAKHAKCFLEDDRERLLGVGRSRSPLGHCLAAVDARLCEPIGRRVQGNQGARNQTVPSVLVGGA